MDNTKTKVPIRIRFNQEDYELKSSAEEIKSDRSGGMPDFVDVISRQDKLSSQSEEVKRLESSPIDSGTSS